MHGSDREQRNTRCKYSILRCKLQMNSRWGNQQPGVIQEVITREYTWGQMLQNKTGSQETNQVQHKNSDHNRRFLKRCTAHDSIALSAITWSNHSLYDVTIVSLHWGGMEVNPLLQHCFSWLRFKGLMCLSTALIRSRKNISVRLRSGFQLDHYNAVILFYLDLMLCFIFLLHDPISECECAWLCVSCVSVIDW